jgi:serine protease SohB
LTDALIAYALFLAKALTIAALAGAVLVALVRARRGSQAAEERIEITDLNDKYREAGRALKRATLSGKTFRKAIRAEHKEDKARNKAGGEPRRRVFVMDFHGDIKASEVTALRECITAVLLAAREGRHVGNARPEMLLHSGHVPHPCGPGAVSEEAAGACDEVLVRLENAGGLVAEHGLAASQLARLRARKIPLTVTVDKVAASGGYLMACVADRILAAPFAVVGSIGVVAQLPNFHRVLERHGVDFELHTAGEYKRTLTLFGENTETGREKLREQIEETHRLFKDYIAEYRPSLDLARVATGEYWHGRQALDLGLVDAIQTSDDYLLEAYPQADLLHLKYAARKRPIDRLLAGLGSALQRALG